MLISIIELVEMTAVTIQFIVIFRPSGRKFIGTEHDHSIYIYMRIYVHSVAVLPLPPSIAIYYSKRLFCFRNKVHYARAHSRAAERLFNVCYRVFCKSITTDNDVPSLVACLLLPFIR